MSLDYPDRDVLVKAICEAITPTSPTTAGCHPVDVVSEMSFRLEGVYAFINTAWENDLMISPVTRR